MISDIYKAQVDLLLEVIPALAKHPSFAIKGGTAINLFYHDMPRLSVDIDLCYLPIRERQESFKDMHQKLSEIKVKLEKLGFEVLATRPLNGGREAKLLVSRSKIVIKIEPNYILRGCLFEPEERAVTALVEAEFQKTATALVLNQNDLYGGKFCAALDRQHPRDLFDVYNFFKTQDITPQVKDSFLFYLLSHNRPMHELLDPRDLIIENIYETEFQGMTREAVSLEELLSARTMLKSRLHASLDDRDRNLLISIADNAPNWSLYRHPKVKECPSIRWTLHNIGKTDKSKRKDQLLSLERILASH